jgi:hypothetical protein
MRLALVRSQAIVRVPILPPPHWSHGASSATRPAGLGQRLRWGYVSPDEPQSPYRLTTRPKRWAGPRA